MKSIREQMEDREYEMLSPHASKSRETRGRDVPEEPCDVRTEYQRDRDRILHCKAFRRLKHKTQVFLAPVGDHYRTRLTHTLEVAQIARTIARALRLNEDLTEAIALGHDLGHTPFGHAGEDILNRLCTGGFSHYEQSVRIVERLEKKGRGLNLTWEVRDGIRNHRTSGHPSTPEGQIVRLSDKIAYINHDIDDAIAAGLLTEDMLPESCTRVLGHSVRERLNSMIHAIIDASLESDTLQMAPDCEDAMMNLRTFMFQNVYRDSKPKREDDKAKELLRRLYEYYMEHTEALAPEYLETVWIYHESWSRAVCDYIAGMTDDYAIRTYREIFMPRSWQY